jgi:hypothetical protein
MIWVAYFMIALEILAIALGLRIMWVMISEASRAPADSSSVVEHPLKRPPAQSPVQLPEAKDEDFPAPFTLEEVDERGYVSSRELRMGCEAAVCRTPFGGRIVAGRSPLRVPQYAWDYPSVRLAEKALVYARFNTHPREGIIGVEDSGRGRYPAAEPQEYLRRWRYTPEGQLESF